MNIVFVSQELKQSNIIAQPWRHVHELAKRMGKEGHDVTVLTDTAKNLPDREAIEGVPIHRIKKGRLLFDNDRLLEALNRQDIDIINWNGSDLWSAFHIWRLRKELRNNIVWTLHSGRLSIGDLQNLKSLEVFSLGPYWNTFLNALCPTFAIKRWANSSLIRLATVLSERIKESLQKVGFSKEIKVIRSGVNTAIFNPVAANMHEKTFELGFEKNDSVIVYFGQESSFRGTDTLMKAMPEILKKAPSSRLLLLIRDIGGNKRVQRNDRITTIRGILNEDELVRYLSLADIFVLPFRFWPQVECPLTVLEAMAMGKPVVTTNLGAIPEIVRDNENGLLIPPKNPKMLAEAVTTLLTDKELSSRIGKNARNYVERFHSWDSIMHETLSAFKAAEC